MELAPALARYAHALGRWQAAWRFASPRLRRAVALEQISTGWDVFRRDAGPGNVGRAHEDQPDRAGVTMTDDPRRDGVLLWLADYGIPAIAEAAGLLGRMVGATRPLGAEEHELLQAARDALTGTGRPGALARSLPPTDHGDDLLASLRTIAVTIDQLRADPAFLESAGAEVRHHLPHGRVSHYVPAEPGATWALNLALLTRALLPQATLPVPGLVSRMLFRPDAEPEELATALVDGATAALMAAYVRVEALRAELDRGDAALGGLSRNSRAPDAWLLAAALRIMTRTQLGRSLGLSRAGADIQARALAAGELVRLASGGRIEWQQQRPAECAPARLDEGLSGAAAAALDATMAEVDRLLARTAR